MSKELDIPDRYDVMHKVVERFLKGENPTTITKTLNAQGYSLKRAQVLDFIDEYKDIARSDDQVKDRAREALYGADQHFNMVLERSWETVEQADNSNDLKTKATVLKNIVDTEAKRVEMLQKAGLYDDAALGDELAEMEEKQQILIGILKEVTAHCDKCKVEVARRLSKVTGQSETVVVDVEVGEGQ